MKPVQFPNGFSIEGLRRNHPRSRFKSGEPAVDDWLATKALQNQEKHLSVTRVLVDASGAIAGYFTLATGQIDFSELPASVSGRLPRRLLPAAVLAWLGVNLSHQRKGLGERLLAQALRDCHEAGKTFPFVAIILDCLNESAKKFYSRFDFAEVPGHPYRLFLSYRQVEAMLESTD